MADKIFENLNEKQVEAAKIIDGPVLVTLEIHTRNQ